MGGFSLQSEGFDAFFFRAMRALEVGFGSSPGKAGLCGQFKQLMEWMQSSAMHGQFVSSSEKAGVGMSPSHVFPLAPMSRGGVLLKSWQVKSDLDKLCWAGGNMVVACFNWMHGGQEQGVLPVVSAAQRRVHSRIERALEAIVMTDEPILSKCGLEQFLRHTEFYTGEGVTLALGMRGGVPDHAADVDLSDHLRQHFPVMSQQVINPGCLLLASKRRPRRVKRGYTWLAPSYPDLVRRNVKAGLHRYKKASQVAKHRGVKCLAGAFAVKKDEFEDRVITDPSVNQLLDPQKLPRPKFAYIPGMRCLSVPKSGLIAVSKRDARHYFHRLRIGKNWQRWLCGPPVILEHGGVTRVRYPACQSAPMGFGPSAGWAQGLTDVVALDAKLPEECRVHPDVVMPEKLPVWGSIIDDIWALEHVADEGAASVGPEWLNRAEASWVDRGVQPNIKKSVNGAFGEEIQGYYVHPTKHWIGLSYEKRRYLFQASFVVLMQKRCHVKVLERLIGKHGFAHSCKPCLRSIFLVSYSWLEKVRKDRAGMVELPDEVWEELLISTLLIPFCEFDLSGEWSNRIEATDSSMSGLGRSFGFAPSHVIQTLARYTSHKGVYTNLSLPWSIGLTTEHKCPLRKVRVPIERIRWFHVGCPWSPSHITLGEADAIAWCAEDRLRRANDDGKRFVHPLDSAACVGAFSKGRSSSMLINRRCRRVAAIQLGGGHEVFYPWVPSAENPADVPSRWFEAGAGRDKACEPESSEPICDLHDLWPWPEGSKFFIHLCSGPDRAHDLVDSIERQFATSGVEVVGLRVDPLAWCSHGWTLFEKADLFHASVGLGLLSLIHSGRVIGGFGSPPCSTVSAARHVPLKRRGGPRPLRHRDMPWNALAYCTQKEIDAVRVGNVLFLLCLGLLGEIRHFGGWIGLEHPADRMRHPYPSFFATSEVEQFKTSCRVKYFVTDQCRFGAPSRKPTGLLLPPKCAKISKCCNHVGGHDMLIGVDSDGRFKTTPAARYPREFCEALGYMCVKQYIVSRKAGYEQPFKSISRFQGEFLEPWTNRQHVSFQWPQPSTAFLVSELEVLNHRKISGGTSSPQQ